MYSVIAHVVDGVRVAPAASSAGLRLGLRPLSLHLGLNINVDALVLTLCPTPYERLCRALIDTLDCANAWQHAPLRWSP